MVKTQLQTWENQGRGHVNLSCRIVEVCVYTHVHTRPGEEYFHRKDNRCKDMESRRGCIKTRGGVQNGWTEGFMRLWVCEIVDMAWVQLFGALQTHPKSLDFIPQGK